MHQVPGGVHINLTITFGIQGIVSRRFACWVSPGPSCFLGCWGKMRGSGQSEEEKSKLMFQKIQLSCHLHTPKCPLVSIPPGCRVYQYVCQYKLHWFIVWPGGGGDGGRYALPRQDRWRDVFGKEGWKMPRLKSETVKDFRVALKSLEGLWGEWCETMPWNAL